jgi:DNA-binding response OmpR family regulator
MRASAPTCVARTRRPPGPPTVGDLVVEPVSRRVLVGGRELTLRTKEFDLLARLAAEPGVAVSRERLMSDVWDENWFGSTKTLDVHIATLRRRLSEAGGGASVPQITTLRGFGYRLEEVRPDGSAPRSEH